MKILVVGGNGQIGFCLTKKLRETGWDFLSLTQLQLDITNSGRVREVVEGYMPDILVNAAAFTSVDKAEIETELAYKVNSFGSQYLAQAAVRIGAPILHISTDYVFSGLAQNLYVEDDETNPQSVYGSSKLEGERAVIDANSKHIILRTSWVFGEHGNNFVKTMIRLGCDRKQLSVVSDQIGGPTYAGDIADALIKIIRQYEISKNLSWGIYHFSGFPYVSWFEFAKLIFNEANLQNIYGITGKCPVLNAIAAEDYPSPVKRPANSRLNCIKIQKGFNIEMSNWKKALKNINAYL